MGTINKPTDQGKHQIKQKGDFTPTPLEDWLNSDVATDMLGISLRSLQNLRSSGMLPYAKLCGKCYYKRSDLEALLESKYGCINAKQDEV